MHSHAAKTSVADDVMIHIAQLQPTPSPTVSPMLVQPHVIATLLLQTQQFLRCSTIILQATAVLVEPTHSVSMIKTQVSPQVYSGHLQQAGATWHIRTRA